MYPNNQPQSIDYLNQIAPQSTKVNLFANKKIAVAIVLAAITILVFIFITINSLIPKPSLNQQLAAKLLATEEILTDVTPKIKTSQLRTYNGNLKIYLTNTIRDITPLLAKEKIDINKLSQKILDTESSTDVLTRLENARLNAVYDRTYAREMAYQLDTIVSLMTKIQKSTKSSSLKLFLEDAIKNLVPTQKQFAEFNAANS
ncbi:MAG: hypothetical protein WCQ49_00815 [Candidatus Saccharibacteria bacterium]